MQLNDVELQSGCRVKRRYMYFGPNWGPKVVLLLQVNDP